MGSRMGALCVLTYLLEGAMGLPVFSQARAGFIHLLGPTGGYLTGFVFAAGITGYLSEKGWGRKVMTTVFSMCLGLVSIYVSGVIWLSFYTGLSAAVYSGIVPFVAGDIAKIILASALLPAGWKMIGKRA